MISTENNSKEFLVENLAQFIATINLVMPLINALSNMTFFVKNTHAQYTLVNAPFAERCNIKNLDDIIGKRSEEVFNYELGLGYTDQDFHVMKSRRRLIDKLELHLYKKGIIGWCLTTKIPIFDRHQDIIGIAGISVDLQDEKLVKPELNTKLKRVISYIDDNFHLPIMVQDLADLSNLSISQFDRQFKSIFLMTPQQFIQKKRLEHAIFLLTKDLSITEISSQCGYTDHSAFSRKFKEMTALTPSQFKKQLMKD